MVKGVHAVFSGAMPTSLRDQQTANADPLLSFSFDAPSNARSPCYEQRC